MLGHYKKKKFKQQGFNAGVGTKKKSKPKSNWAEFRMNPTAWLSGLPGKIRRGYKRKNWSAGTGTGSDKNSKG